MTGHDPNCKGCFWCRQPDEQQVKVAKKLVEVGNGLELCDVLLSRIKQLMEGSEK